jgi:hypothetical protein
MTLPFPSRCHAVREVRAGWTEGLLRDAWTAGAIPHCADSEAW